MKCFAKKLKCLLLIRHRSEMKKIGNFETLERLDMNGYEKNRKKVQHSVVITFLGT